LRPSGDGGWLTPQPIWLMEAQSDRHGIKRGGEQQWDGDLVHQANALLFGRVTYEMTEPADEGLPIAVIGASG